MRLERDELLLQALNYKSIKDKVIYSTVMKKAGGNKKGFLSRLFVLYKGFVIYYKTKTLLTSPEKPQGYIDLRECDPSKVKTILDDTDMTFQIVHRAGRTFLIKGDEPKPFRRFFEICKCVALKLTQITFTLPVEKQTLLNQILDCNMSKEDFKHNIELFLKDGFVFNVNLISQERTEEVKTLVKYILDLRKEEIAAQSRIAKITIESGGKKNVSMGTPPPTHAATPDLMVTLVIPPENEPMPEIVKIQNELHKIRLDIEEHRMNIFNIQIRDHVESLKQRYPEK
ncbi:hypothetical protein ACTFIV_004486 [Dictyostelium citrinum]